MKTVQVQELPFCDLCKQNDETVKAEYDAPTVFGPWANMCYKHYRKVGKPSIGSRLEEIEKITVKKPSKILSVSVPLTLDGDAVVYCPYCQQPRNVELDANYLVDCEACSQKYKVVSCI